MADYQCYPLWWAGPEEPGNVNPAELPLSPETVVALDGWSETFDSWMDLKDPTSNREPTQEEFDAFETEGVRLWLRIREELAPDYDVSYRSAKFSRVFNHPEELSQR